MPTTSEPEYSLYLEESPTGPMTLSQEIRMTDRAVQVHERMRYGNGFIAPGSIERTRREQGDLHARMELLLEVHPELTGMYAEHEQLLNSCYTDEKGGMADVAVYQERAAALGRQIVAIEGGVDLG